MKRINVIDVFIILLLVLSLVGVGVRLGTNAYLNNKNNTEYILTLQVSAISDVKENAVAVNDKVYLTESSELIGVISEVKLAPQGAFTEPSDTSQELPNIEKYDMTCTVTVKGNMTENGFMLEGGKYIYIGMTLDISTTGYRGSTVVMGITNKNQ